MNITQEFETITAIATPLGEGGVGVVRISGEKAFEITAEIFKKPLEAGKIAHGWIVDGEKKIDEAIVLPFKTPNSFTGEDVVEIQCHGGVNVLRNVLELVLSKGARMAERGEFTKRAFLNGKLDLSQAEAVLDLIHAKTQKFALQSAKNLSGALAEKTREIKKDIFEVLSKITAGIDFPEDVKEPEYDYLIKEFTSAIAKLDKILECAKSSDIQRQGVKVAIAGRPNVGKSSLFNALLNTERAIVTDIAGTTRDVIKETLDFDGIPVTLFDTAGLHDKTDDKVEKIGIEYTKQSVDEADLVLFLYEAAGMTADDKTILKALEGKNIVMVANKKDLFNKTTETLAISTKTGEGLKDLKATIKDKVCNYSIEDSEFVTNNRQKDCLEKCRESLDQALLAAQVKEFQDLISIDVKQALLYLDEITGEVITDDILNNIFENFCIGK